MTNVVEQILHPESEKEEMQAQIAHLEEILEKTEEDRDIYQEKAEGADDCVFDQREKIQNFIERNTNKQTGEVNITLEKFQNELANRRKHRWDSEFDVLGYVADVLKYIEPEIRYKTEVVNVGSTVYKEVPPKDLFMIWSIEHDAWWSPFWRGYTKDRREAGTYTYEEALKIVKEANEHRGPTSSPNEAMVHYQLIKNI